MKIEDLVPPGSSVAEIIGILKYRVHAPNIYELRNELNPDEHRIASKDPKDDWPDKNISDEKGDITDVHRVMRIKVAMQKLIVKRSVSFLFGNNPTFDCEPGNAQEAAVFNAIKRINADSKTFAINREVARGVASFTEAAECWFSVPKPNWTKYGFKTDRKLRVQVFDANRGDILYPKFDLTRDLIAFSREYHHFEPDGSRTIYFETYTDEEKVVWSFGSDGYKQMSREVNPIEMIPIVYARQWYTEWHDVKSEIERLELLLSQFAETNRYFTSPKLVVNGTVKGFSKAGRVGETIELEGVNSEVKYLTWDHAPESVKLEIETLFEIIFKTTQTPDISFNNVKGIGHLSGIAIKLLFLDAHLKVEEKKEIFIPYLQRRTSIQCAYIGMLDVSLKAAAASVMISPEITAYTIKDDLVEAQVLTTLNGGKPVISQYTSVAQSNRVDNVDEEYNKIQEEAKAAAQQSAFSPTF